MREFIDKLLAQIREAFGKMDRKNKRGLLIIAFFIVVFAIIAVILLTQTTYVPIHSFETIAQAEQVYARLQGAGINARREGTRILVPENQQEQAFNEVRDAIGTPQLTMDIMDTASGFGVTDRHQREIYSRQLADDIRVQIEQSPRVASAVVIIRPGESSPFRTATNLARASASIMITLTDSGMLSQVEVDAIAAMVIGAVQGIELEDIHITDNNLNVYRLGDENMEFEDVLTTRLTMKNMLERQIRLSVEQVLARVFLRNNVEVIPSVTLNFDKKSEQIVEFAPPVAGEMEGLVRSSSDLYEQHRARLEAAGIPGTDTNNMGMGEYPWGELGENELYRKVVQERNYELNEMLRTIEYAEGTIESLTVGILINSEAHEEDMSEEIINLVAMGVDIPPERVVVESLPFALDTTYEDQMAAWEAQEAALRQQELIRMGIIAAVILAIGVLFFILGRNILYAVKPPPEPVPAEGPEIDMLVDGELDPEALLAAELEAQRLADIDLQAKQKELESIESFIEKDPAAVAQLLRNWITED